MLTGVSEIKQLKFHELDSLEEPVRVSIVCAFILSDGQASQS